MCHLPLSNSRRCTDNGCFPSPLPLKCITHARTLLCAAMSISYLMISFRVSFLNATPLTKELLLVPARDNQTRHWNHLYTCACVCVCCCTLSTKILILAAKWGPLCEVGLIEQLQRLGVEVRHRGLVRMVMVSLVNWEMYHVYERQ